MHLFNVSQWALSFYCTFPEKNIILLMRGLRNLENLILWNQQMLKKRFVRYIFCDGFQNALLQPFACHQPWTIIYGSSAAGQLPEILLLH